MIQFNTLKISPDGKNLIIEAAVKDLSYYNDILIGSIIIDNQDTYSINGPSKYPIYQQSFSGIDSATSREIKGLRNISITISNKELQNNNGDLNTDILYIYLVAVGTPSADTPCSMDNINTLGISLNLKSIYNSSMNYIKQIEGTCEIPKEFINFILEYKALDLALKTENYIQVNKYWNKFFKSNKVISLNTTSCGCT